MARTVRRRRVHLTTAASRKGPASTTTTSIGLDVTPRRISTEYGLSRAVNTRSINRRPPAELADHWWARWHMPSNSKYFDARSIMALDRIRLREAASRCLSSTLTNTLTRRRWGPTVLPRTKVSHATRTLDRSGAATLPSLELGRHAPIVNEAFRATLAEDVMIH